jgi:small nuclear ribonucleoprotein (snRNP)-like protein
VKYVSPGNAICYCDTGFAALPNFRIKHGRSPPDRAIGQRTCGRLLRKEIGFLARQNGSNMPFFKKHYPKRQHPARRFDEFSGGRDPAHPEQTGSESAYLKSLIDSNAKVTVILNNGERLRGRIRYYDRHCFSIGLSAEGPKIFLRKSSVSYISEE